jgi:hypothetical protein
MFLGLANVLTSIRRNFIPWIKDGLKLHYFFRQNSDLTISHTSAGSTSFDGTNDYIDTGTSISSAVSGAFTVSAWVRMGVGHNSSGVIFSTVSGTNGFGLEKNTSEQMALWVGDGSDFLFSNSPVMNLNQWYHIVGMHDGVNTISMYMDGILVDTTAQAPAGSFSAPGIIGRHSTLTDTSRWWAGSIANVGIWSRALSASEVQGIMYKQYSELGSVDKASLVSWWGLEDTSLGEKFTIASAVSDANGNEADSVGNFIGTGSPTAFEVSGSGKSDTTKNVGNYALKCIADGDGEGFKDLTLIDGGLTVGASYTLSFDYKNANGVVQFILQKGTSAGSIVNTYNSLNATSWTSYSTTFTATEDDLRFYLTQYSSTSATWYFDNLSIKEVQSPDSESTNHGTIVGATTNSTIYGDNAPQIPRILDVASPKQAVQLADGSTSFDGINDYVQVGALGDLGTSTVAMWIKRTNTSDYHYLIDARENSGTGYFYADNAGTTLVTSSGTIYVNGSAGATIPTGEWCHIAITGITLDIAQGVKIGSRYTDEDFFPGSIANVSIHSSALTQSQVQEVMFAEKYAGLSSGLKTNLVSWYDLGDTSLGSELVTDGDMSNAGSWTAESTAVIASNVCTVTGATNNQIIIRQSVTLTDGKLYRLIFTVSSYGAGAGEIYARVSEAGSNVQTLTMRNANGTYTEDFTASENHTRLDFLNGNTGNYIIDDVSIKEIQIEDLEGSNDGSVYGATTTTGYTSSPHGVVDPINYGTIKSGTAVSFDGVNDVIKCGTGLGNALGDNYSGALSLSMWFKTDVTSGDDGLFGLGGFAGNGDFDVLIMSNGIHGALNSWGWRQYISFTDTTSWHHLVVIADISGGESASKMYLDGELQTTTTTGSFPSASDMDFAGLETRIGQYGNEAPSYFLDGKASSVKFFNTNLTQAQVQELFLNPEQILPTGVSSSNLKLYLPMNEGVGAYNYDGSGNQNHGTISGATWDTANTDIAQVGLVRQNKPMIFDGSNDVVACGDGTSLDMTTAYTLSGWVYLDSITGATQFLFGRDDGSNRNYFIELTTTATVSSVNFGTSQVATTTSTVLTVGAWSHICTTYDGSNVKIYLNGALDTSESVTGTLDNDNVSFSIGAREAGLDRFFAGKINEVAVWDVALDADAVTALYGSGTPLLPTSDSGNYDNSGDLQGYWRNDNDTTWTDRSTNSNHGTASGSPASIVLTEGLTSGRDSQGFYLTDTTENCLTLNGNGYVEIPDSEVLSFGDSINDRPFSIEFWGNAESGALLPFFIWKGTGNRANVEYWIQITTGQILFYVGDVTGHSNRLGRFENLDVRDGNWHHYTFTYDGSGAEGGMKFYYDTSRVDDSSDSAGSYTAMHNSTAPLVIGRSGYDGTSYADSRIDDFRIYSQELSSDEVTKNYNAGKSKHS